MFNVANLLAQMGANFYQQPNMTNNVQNASLDQDPITQMTRNQMIVATYAMMAFWMLQQQLQQQLAIQNQQSQDKTVGYSRGLKPNNSGMVNLALLVSIILFIMSIFLFITQ